MQTEVIMQRELFGMPISQKSKSEFFSLTDLERAGNKWRAINGLPSFDKKQWLETKQVKEFIHELEEKYGTVIITARGRGTHTWVHPLLFIDMALAISPKLKIEVYEWLFDKLLDYRNDSGDSYKEAAAALYTRATNHKEFPNTIKRVANDIRIACGVIDWQKATQEQLKLRDSIHVAIKLYSRVLTDTDEIVRLAILECKR